MNEMCDSGKRPLRRILLVIAYDGTGYCGWQVQPNGISIQSVVQAAVEALVGEKIRLTGASRTDAGVHALGQAAVFDTHSTIPAERFAPAINQKLPEDIVVQSSREVPGDFHPRYEKTSKTYEYKILNRRSPLPCQRMYSYFFPRPLDVEAMAKAAKCLCGTHDFKNFASVKTTVRDTVRTIEAITVIKDADDMITVRVRGNGFLYNMVRIIVGALILVGTGQSCAENLLRALESSERVVPGPTAPACGLTLTSICYEKLPQEKGAAREPDGKRRSNET